MIGMWGVAHTKKRSAPAMRENVLNLALNAVGFLAPEEGLKLFELACEMSVKAPCLEVGSYCGKSSLYLGEGCHAAGRFGLFSVDHHRGSIEQQPGQQYFNPVVFDAARGAVDTLPHFLENIARAGLDDYVVPIVADSATAGRNFGNGSLGLVFIDGGHAREDVESDWRTWGRTITRGGMICFHDIFNDRSQGGQAPREVFEAACSRPEWRCEGIFQSLGVVRRR
jgi:MMP 1-O-methyltransferase